MRPCYRCSQWSETWCDGCGVRLTILDTFRPWRRVRRLWERLHRPPATETPVEPEIPLEEWLMAPIHAREEANRKRTAMPSPATPAPTDDAATPGTPAESAIATEHPTP